MTRPKSSFVLLTNPQVFLPSNTLGRTSVFKLTSEPGSYFLVYTTSHFITTSFNNSIHLIPSICRDKNKCYFYLSHMHMITRVYIVAFHTILLKCSWILSYIPPSFPRSLSITHLWGPILKKKKDFWSSSFFFQFFKILLFYHNFSQTHHFRLMLHSYQVIFAKFQHFQYCSSHQTFKKPTSNVRNSSGVWNFCFFLDLHLRCPFLLLFPFLLTKPAAAAPEPVPRLFSWAFSEFSVLVLKLGPASAIGAGDLPPGS